MLFLIASVFPSLIKAQYPPLDQVAPGHPAWTAAVLSNPQNPGGTVDRCPNQNDWALTYDDGPSPPTGTVLNALSTHNAKATFFVVGSRVRTNPQLLIDAFNAGHQIALHTWSHRDLATLTDDEIVAELVWSAKIVKDTIGVTPTMMRPPYGSTSPRALELIRAMGFRVILWNRDTNDCMYFSPLQ